MKTRKVGGDAKTGDESGLALTSNLPRRACRHFQACQVAFLMPIPVLKVSSIHILNIN